MGGEIVRINNQARYYDCSHGHFVGPVGKKHMDSGNFVRNTKSWRKEREVPPSVREELTYARD
jgi:hypothetical protein